MNFVERLKKYFAETSKEEILKQWDKSAIHDIGPTIDEYFKHIENMVTIEVQINNCQACPFFKTSDPWSSDGWDRMVDWYCQKEDKKIQGAVEWHEESKIPVPEWCPIKKKETNEDQSSKEN